MADSAVPPARRRRDQGRGRSPPSTRASTSWARSAAPSSRSSPRYNGRQARRADVERDGRALDGAQGVRRQVERRGAGALAHRLPDHRGHLLRGRRPRSSSTSTTPTRSTSRTPPPRSRRARWASCPCTSTGTPPTSPAIQELCAERSLWLLEDCAQAHGAAWQGTQGRLLRARGRVLVLPVEEPHRDGRRRAARHRRRRGRRALPPAARPRPAEQGRPRRGRLQPALQRHPGRRSAACSCAGSTR